MNIDLAQIKKKSNTKAYLRGVRLSEQGYVNGANYIEVEENQFHLSADVEGSAGAEYHVTLDYDGERDRITDYNCECPAYYTYDGMCKHCVALAMLYAKEKKSRALYDFENFINKRSEGVSVITDPQLVNLIRENSMGQQAQYIQPDIAGNMELEPTLIRNYKGWFLSLRVGAENKYTVKDIHTFLAAIAHREKIEYGKKLGFIHEFSVFTGEAQEIILFLQKKVKDYCYYHGVNGMTHYYMPSMRELQLSEESRCEFFNLMAGKSFKLKDYQTKDSVMEVVAGEPRLCVTLEKMSRGRGFSLVLPEMEAIFGNQRLYIRKGNTVYECSKQFSKKMSGICQMGKLNQETVHNIEEKDMQAFCSMILPVLEECTELKVEGELEIYLPQEAVIKIYIDCEKGFVTARLEAEYGEDKYNILIPVQVSDAYRDLEKESKAIHTVGAYFGAAAFDHIFRIEESQEDKVFHLLSTGMQQINEVGEVYVSEAFKRLKITQAPKINIGVAVKNGLLDLTIDSGRLDPQELEGYLQSYRQKRKFYRLKNGDFMKLQNSGLEAVSELVEGLHLKPGELSGKEVTIARNKAFYLDQVLKSEGEGTQVYRDSSFKEMIRNMRDIEDSDYEVPMSLKEIMRNYQKTGFRWLCTLEQMGFGGILADDMGLGKTLQIIAFLLFYKYRKEVPCEPGLIVCPASLVYNWESEIEKFAPELKALVLVGANTERKKLLDEYKDYDVLITSYDLLKRDLESYKGKHFSVEVIDEAQNIKNHSTQAAKAVKEIQSDTRFALTGTPIENRLSELWSIFDYLMPGMLGAYQKFKSEYESPIVAGSDELVVRRLQKMIKPFILRRLKTDVLKDLPDKEENIVYSKLEGEQAKIYAANVQKMLDSLNKTSKDEFQNEKLQILAQLTKLRQICCAPALVYADFKGNSAKIDTCMELLRSAVEGGHKVLIFSQFTSLFLLLETELKKEKIGYYKLTGQTEKAKRAHMVTEFNQNDIPVFLISLKAGGTGLNLTGANIVIHFDPWWNVAAQNQATDRAHRIGQMNTVSVYKLIAKNTIEEKILKLQEAKRDLSDQIISEAGVSATALSKEDLIEILKMKQF